MNQSPEKPSPSDAEAERYRKGKRTFTRIAIFFGTVFLASVVWQFYLINEHAKSLRGDGSDPATYGFDLSNLTVERETLVGARMKKDHVYPLDDPVRVTVDNIGELKKYGARYVTTEVVDHLADGPGGAFKKLLVDSDRVIGITLNGETRCYPLRFMRWHEVANDTLGGVPIAVTYSPHADGGVAFKRTVGDETLTFRHSGMVFNSYHVLYDLRTDDEGKQREADESLWLPLSLAPIAGKAVTRGDQLEPLPLWLGPWGEWREAHPDTTVLVGDAKFGKRYKNNFLAAEEYFENEQLKFPVKPMPPAAGSDDDEAIRPFQRFVAWQAPDGGWFSTVMPEEGHPENIPTDVPRIYTRWFAWYAIRMN